MSKSINAAVYETHGNPADVLQVEMRAWPMPAADEAVVKMSAAPINPAAKSTFENAAGEDKRVGGLVQDENRASWGCTSSYLGIRSHVLAGLAGLDVTEPPEMTLTGLGP
jgi:hypothetical protein